ncbi:MAG: glycosyltransferase [Ginsengibacter sp.]
MGKLKLLIIIDTLKKGGAEILLAGILAELNKKYEVILVTLSEACDFDEDEIIFSHRYHLGFKGKASFIFCVFKLNKIIKKHRPSFIQSHLFYSSLAARIVCPSNVPLLYSLHGEMSKNVFNNSKTLTFLEKKTIKHNHSTIAVSNTVLKDYQNTIGKKYNCFVLKNYISDLYFSKKVAAKKFTDFNKLKLVAAGNIKQVKNYQFLLEAFEHLKGYNISLDIYGTGDSRIFQHNISKSHLKITFKDAVNNLHEILPDYDLYVSCSKHEGFGIAAVEAMASGLPLLLADLPVFHEVTFDNALFFDLKNPMSFVDLIKEIFEKKYDLNRYSEKGIEISKQYNKEKYLSNLYSIYDEILQ